MKLLTPLGVASLDEELPAWEHTRDTLRPHQALSSLTPLQFLTRYTSQREVKRHQATGRVQAVAPAGLIG